MGRGLVNDDFLERPGARRWPFLVWLQITNLATLAVISLLLFKVYHLLMGFFKWWSLPAVSSHDQIRTILFIGSKTALNNYLLQELSAKFTCPVTSLKFSDTPRVGSGRVLLDVSDSYTDRDQVLNLYQTVFSTYGVVDLLIVSEQKNEEESTNFLASLNHQLLAQFWIVTAFLPGMLSRNRGSIMSIALEKTSSLANAGVIRTVYEDVTKNKNTEVTVTLVERNTLIERWFPSLPDIILSRLAVNSIGRSQVVLLPSLSDYIFTVPRLVGQISLNLILDFFWKTRSEIPQPKI